MRNGVSYLSKLRQADPAALEKLLTKTLRETAGSPLAVTKLLGISLNYIWWLLTQHGMRGVPAAERERARNRFRLPRVPAA